jgi:phosphinothricin acetyltransferase
MKGSIRPVSDADWPTVTAIFNHFVEHSFAAYNDEPVDVTFFRERHSANPELPFVVVEHDDRVVGFAYLSPYHSAATMRRTACLTYFLRPEATGLGIGSRLLEHLLEAGAASGIRNFLAHISSHNNGSIRFHLKHGFRECGRFVDVGKKNGQVFDQVWLQLITS